MIKTLYSCRKPAKVDNLIISPYSVKDRTFINILDHYAVDERALGTSIIDVERWLYGNEIARWSHGYDIGPQIEEDKWPEFKRWKEFTEKPQALDVIPVEEYRGYKISARERALGNTDAGMRVLRVHDSVYKGPINRRGIAESEAENLRQNVNNYLVDYCFQITDQAQFLNKFMNSKGYKLKHDIKDFMTGGIPKWAIAKIHFIEEYLAFNKNFRGMIAKSAKAQGVRYNDEKFNTVMHELMHLYGVYSEEELEELSLEFYQLLANREPEGYVMAIPKTIRSEREKYIRMARIPRSRLIAQGKIPSLKDIKNIESLVEQLYAEAKEKGLDEIGAQQYVDACLEIYEKAEKADYKETKESGKSKSDKDSEKTDKELSEEEMAKEAPNEEAKEETAEAESSETSE